MKRAPQVLSLFFVCPLLLLLMLMKAARQTVDATSATFSFAVGGDHSANSKATSSLDLLANGGVDFYLALGDMSYSQLVPESTWCDYVKSHVGPTFPFEVLPAIMRMMVLTA